MNEYVYTIDPLSVDRLTQEIQQSAIVTSLNHIDSLGDQVSIWFNAALSGGDETLLDGIVAAHTGVPLAQPPLLVSMDETKTADDVLIVDTALRRGKPGAESVTIVTHEFSDRTTWYQNSVRLTNEALSDIGGNAFQADSGKRNWININSLNLAFDWKRIPKRDGTMGAHSDWAVVVKVDDVEVAASTYTVDFALGKVTFGSAPGGVVTATFSHNDEVTNMSDFIVCPPPGKRYLIEHVEVQFSKNIAFTNDILFEIWAGGTLGDYGDFPDYLYDAGYGQNRSTYRGVRDLINWCNNQYPVIPAPSDEFVSDILVFPFRFLVCVEMRSDQGTIFRVFCKDHLPQNAEISTATLYMEMSPL